ncbi:unnamed protein product [Aureobasidium uvarum]|uniref:HPt domain-containing protein n=1 Tax=Aureobasidium uvarum TaxID=2773716 RepID=A0A9N8PY24_9PEZI|nr:unnamed protein product [Aureobasidium uvarum]
MAVHQPLSIQSKRRSISLLIQPINNIQPAMTAQALALEKLGRSVDMSIFSELLDLDSPSEMFSKDVVCEYLVMAPETLATMKESLTHINLSQLNTSTQSLRCASMVLGLTRIEKACSRIETILTHGVELHYTGIGLGQICEILSFVVKDAHSHFELAKMAFSSFYSLPMDSPREDASDASSASFQL